MMAWRKSNLIQRPIRSVSAGGWNECLTYRPSSNRPTLLSVAVDISVVCSDDTRKPARINLGVLPP